MANIYCAGPLFNDYEREEMRAIATALESAGHRSYLPQRDGLEAEALAKYLGQHAGDHGKGICIHNRAIFLLDVYRLLSWSEAVVANLNGRVPDEGTVVECALAWHANKALVLYKKDTRAPFNGLDNPMLAELSGGYLVEAIDALPDAVEHALSTDRAQRVEHAVALGERVASLRDEQSNLEELARALVELLGGNPP
jgi:nucleoside 2-deoxyribosyltransferase